jgi:hypothetical protein
LKEHDAIMEFALVGLLRKGLGVWGYRAAAAAAAAAATAAGCRLDGNIPSSAPVATQCRLCVRHGWACTGAGMVMADERGFVL